MTDGAIVDEGSVCESASAGRSSSREAAFYKSVVQGMRCGIVTVDGNGCILTVNGLAREILELDGPIEEGSPVEDVLSRHPRLATVLRDSLEMSHLPNRAEMEIRSKEDDGRTIGFTISPIRDDGGSVDGVALFFKDLTIVERQEEQDRLRDRLAALGQMAASLAHEIRNPLASIDVTATLLNRKIDDVEQQRLLDKILDEIGRLNRIVAHGLEFARPLVPERSLRSMGELLDVALEEACARTPDQQIRVSKIYHPDAPPVPADRTLMIQVFVNLIANAIDAMGGQGELVLEVVPVSRPEREPSAVDVLIRDNGPGIPDEVRQKVFYPFVTTKKNGSGIGLAMARKVIECHHGVIDVESCEGEGTCFRVRLPGATEEDGTSWSA